MLLPAWVLRVPLQDGVPKENDEINVVWVVDSEQLPFYRAGAPSRLFPSWFLPPCRRHTHPHRFLALRPTHNPAWPVSLSVSTIVHSRQQTLPHTHCT